jgi:hypothetical protein
MPKLQTPIQSFKEKKPFKIVKNYWEHNLKLKKTMSITKLWISKRWLKNNLVWLSWILILTLKLLLEFSCRKIPRKLYWVRLILQYPRLLQMKHAMDLRSGKRLIIVIIWQLLRNIIVRLLMLIGNLLLHTIRNLLLHTHFRKITWPKNEDLYDSKYTDLLRVISKSRFRRRKPSDLIGYFQGEILKSGPMERKLLMALSRNLKKIHISL